MTIEPITERNIESAWELYQRNIAECDHLPLDWFRYKVLDDPDYSPETALVAVESGKAVAFMDAVCRTWEGGPVGWLKAWATDSESRGQGIATELLRIVEERFRSLGAKQIRAGQSKPHYYTPGIDPSAYTPAMGFLLRRGFRPAGYAYNMDVPLPGRSFRSPEIEERMSDSGIAVRRVETAGKKRFVNWVKDAGWGYSWEYQSARACDADPSAAFIAEKDGEIVGFAVYDAVRPSWFGPMGALEKMRGTGIGSAVLFACLEDMKDRGYPVCHICAVGPLYFYAKAAGAVVSRTFWHMMKDLP